MKKILNFNNNYDFLQNRNISLKAQDFIKCCIKKNPFERFNTFELLKHPFITYNLKKSVRLNR